MKVQYFTQYTILYITDFLKLKLILDMIYQKVVIKN